MRVPSGASLPPGLKLRPGRADVYRTLRGAILDGVFSAGERLPSTRQAAADYGVSRGVLEEAFAQLTEEGFLERAVGRGTFVARSIAPVGAPGAALASCGLAAASRRGRALARMAACREPVTPRAFNAGMADANEFPWKKWRKLLGRAGREGLAFADPRGLGSLRAAIARHLAQCRGLRCRTEQVIVFNSAQQAIHALALLLLNPGNTVWLEDPCYLGARSAFELAGAVIAPAAVDEQGLDVEAAARRAPRARMAYVTPSHQYPSGVALSMERRGALLEWAAQRKAWVIEDDYDGEFRYGGQPLTSLYALDGGRRVLYVGTFNKAMFVGLRIGYAVVPDELVEALGNIRTQLDGFTAAAAQLAMGLFLDEGYFASHLRRMRALYGAKRARLVEGLEPLAARGWSWAQNPAGMHLVVRHRDGAAVRKIVESSGLDLALLSTYRIREARGDGLFLRFGGLDGKELETGIERLVATERRTEN